MGVKCRARHSLETASMFYDVPYRHQQAVDPAALSTIAITLQAMTKALDDCRNAGVDPNTDPAMVLLARHMATVSTNRAPRSVLRHACDKRLQSLKRYPALLAEATTSLSGTPRVPSGRSTSSTGWWTRSMGPTSATRVRRRSVRAASVAVTTVARALAA